jgi:disulfide bond formation protein DsbB
VIPGWSENKMTAPLFAAANRSPIAAAALLIAAIGSATILGAYFFEYVLALAPCPLCLEQRIPYYVAIPLAVLIAIGAYAGGPRTLLVAGLGLVLLAMLIGAGLGAYHAGIEWGWWAGPRDCSGPINDIGSAGTLMKQLQTINVVRCDEAAWRFLGLSLAGYNVLISLALAALAAWGIGAGRRAASYGSSSVSQYR